MPGFIEKNIASISNFIEQVVFQESSVSSKGFLQSMDPRIKLFILAAFILTVSLLRETTSLAVFTAVPFILAFASGIDMAGFSKRVFVFVPLFTVIIAIPALFTVPGTPVVETAWFTITEEGLRSAAFLVLRVSASISATVLLILTTGWDNMLFSMKKLHLPEALVSLLGISYRYIHLLLRNLLEILEARKSRVFGRLPFRRNVAILAQSGAYLFLKTLHLAEGVRMSMLSRGGYNEVRMDRVETFAAGRSHDEETTPTKPKSDPKVTAGRQSISIDEKDREGENKTTGTTRAFSLKEVLYVYPGGIKGVEIPSLQIESGKCTVLLGANGSGKSTLLKLLDGLIFPESGSIEVLGRKLTEGNLEREEFRSFFRQKVALVFQDPDVQCFSPTVYEELAFGPRQKRLAECDIERIVKDAMRLMNIEHLSGRYPYNLSGGEKKRVAVASILTIDPEIYLMDEPTGGLDPATEGTLIDLLLDLREKGKTIIVATQDLVLARHIADRAVILGSEKKLLTHGKAETVLCDTETLRAADLMHVHRFPHTKGKPLLYHSHYQED